MAGGRRPSPRPASRPPTVGPVPASGGGLLLLPLFFLSFFFFLFFFFLLLFFFFLLPLLCFFLFLLIFLFLFFFLLLLSLCRIERHQHRRRGGRGTVCRGCSPPHSPALSLSLSLLSDLSPDFPSLCSPPPCTHSPVSLPLTSLSLSPFPSPSLSLSYLTYLNGEGAYMDGGDDGEGTEAAEWSRHDEDEASDVGRKEARRGWFRRGKEGGDGRVAPAR